MSRIAPAGGGGVLTGGTRAPRTGRPTDARGARRASRRLASRPAPPCPRSPPANRWRDPERDSSPHAAVSNPPIRANPSPACTVTLIPASLPSPKESWEPDSAAREDPEVSMGPRRAVSVRRRRPEADARDILVTGQWRARPASDFDGETPKRRLNSRVKWAGLSKPTSTATSLTRTPLPSRRVRAASRRHVAQVAHRADPGDGAEAVGEVRGAHGGGARQLLDVQLLGVVLADELHRAEDPVRRRRRDRRRRAWRRPRRCGAAERGSRPTTSGASSLRSSGSASVRISRSSASPIPGRRAA